MTSFIIVRFVLWVADFNRIFNNFWSLRSRKIKEDCDSVIMDNRQYRELWSTKIKNDGNHPLLSDSVCEADFYEIFLKFSGKNGGMSDVGNR